MNITLASAFVNSAPTLTRYFNQAIALQDALLARGDTLLCLWGEGDSTDNTRSMLDGAGYRIKSRVIDVTHGGQIFGSVESAERFRQLAHIGQRIWAEIPRDCDVFVWCESDLIWDAETMLALIDHVGTHPAISPMILLDRPRWGKRTFYDVFMFRLDGRHFQHAPPYHPDYVAERPFRVDCVGSCVAMRGDIARRIEIDKTVFAGICEQVYAMGETIWVDPALTVIHN